MSAAGGKVPDPGAICGGICPGDKFEIVLQRKRV